jgi:hypothetical protein
MGTRMTQMTQIYTDFFRFLQNDKKKIRVNLRHLRHPRSHQLTENLCIPFSYFWLKKATNFW